LDPSSDSPRLARFDVFEVDLRSGELRKPGSKIRLQDKPLQILTLLLEHPGEVVTRQEIEKRLWPSGVIVDFEHSINTAVKRLREALGDDAEHPRYIETLPRHGYRFIAAVDVGAGLARPQEGRALPYRFVASATAAVVVIVAAVVALNVAGLRDRLLSVAGARHGVPLPKIESIAVLPLESLSRDPEHEYFADGMTEELITNLGKISALRVISRTSVMRYKGTKKPLPEIAKELNVDTVVEGTVMRAGDRVRITANLMHAPSDRHLWAETYERNLGDVLTLQGEVARAIASEIQVKVTPQERARLASTRPVNPEAYAAYLKGRSSLEAWTEAGCRTAIKWFEKAIDRDSTYAPPYAGVADAYYTLAYLNFVPPREAIPRAKEAAAKALALDESVAEAYASLCWIRTLYDWDWQAAGKACARAVELNPNSAYAQHAFSHYLWVMGRMDEAFLASRHYLELDPLTTTAHVHLGSHYCFSHQYDQAIEQFQEALRLDPNYPEAYASIADPYIAKRKYGEAVAALQKAVMLSKDNPFYLGALAHAYAKAGAREEATKVLDQLKRLSKHKFVGGIDFAIVYTELGDKDRAFEWLAKAFEQRDIRLAYIKVEDLFDPLRSDPRFQNLLRRMNFPP